MNIEAIFYYKNYDIIKKTKIIFDLDKILYKKRKLVAE